ncbi:hypothetical protein [Lysinibacillus fusiformis]|uniref:hypothetical protein n=1 Tax=Lysinibacillus fusiformis TaxID=28031 RepID=UPI0030163BAB
MTQNIVEHLRELAINKLFNTNTFSNVWAQRWQSEVNSKLAVRNATNIINLGDHLTEIFKSTSNSGKPGPSRTQSDVSGGGAAWEALVCWYLNLCLVGTNTVVVKSSNELIPEPIRESLKVSYGTFVSNTESDLIAITFPSLTNYAINKTTLSLVNNQGIAIPLTIGRNSRFNTKAILNQLAENDFSSYEVGVIQCKTNWNDNAQIPMLWDLIYASNGFRNGVSVGTSAFSIRNLQHFSYSFVTVPTSRGPFTSNSTAVKRVSNLSGGNFWGQSSQSNVAHSIKEMCSMNFSNGATNIRQSISVAIPLLSTTYSYFRL